MKEVIIILAPWHPQETWLETPCPHCRADARKRFRRFTVRCPHCLGMLPASAKYCAWCNAPLYDLHRKQ
jgi:hypothetical protein